MFTTVGPILQLRVQGLWRTCVAADVAIRQQLLWQRYDHPAAEYRGVKKTCASLARILNCHGMHVYTDEYVQMCTRRASKSISQETAGLPQPLLSSPRRWPTMSLKTLLLAFLFLGKAMLLF